MSQVIPFQRRLNVTSATMSAVAQAATVAIKPQEVDFSKLSEKRKIIAEYKSNPIYSFVLAFLEQLNLAMQATFDTTIDYVDLGLGFFIGTTDDDNVEFILYGVKDPAKAKSPKYTANSFITIKGEKNEQAYNLSSERNSLCLNKVGAYVQSYAVANGDKETPGQFFAPHVLISFALNQGFAVTHYNLRGNYTQGKEFFIAIFNPTTGKEYRINVDFGALEV